MESDAEPTTFDEAVLFKETKGNSSPKMSPLQTVENEATTMDGDNSHDVGKPVTLDDSPKVSFDFGMLGIQPARDSLSLNSPGTTEESSVDLDAPAPREPHNSVIVPLSSVMKDRSDRSASVQSVGSCEREASPAPSRRRSTRLRTERSYAHKGDEEHEDDHHDVISGRVSSEKSAHPSDGSHSSKKLSQGLKHLSIVRQINPKLLSYWDAFCWRCHKNIPLHEQHGCPSCERCFHLGCWWNESPYASTKDQGHGTETAHSTSPLMDNENVDAEEEESKEEDRKPSECVECFSMLDESKKEDSPFHQLGPEKFRDILLYMMRFVDEHLQPDRVRPFAIPVLEQAECTPDVKDKYAEVITHPMDLRQIAKNINDGKYSTTASFVADLRWILHNTTIFNGQNNRYTRSAVYIVDTCQNLCCSLEWCPECFLRQMPTASDNGVSEALERGMITPCSSPHAVVWVKAEKFPLWPAIVYRFNGQTADVRFFGAFEFGTFPKEAIYLFTKNPVTDRRKGKLKIEYENALRQFRLHVAKLRVMNNKQVVSYPKRTPYDGRLLMFPEDEEGLSQQPALTHGEDENEAASVAGDDVAMETDNHSPQVDVYSFNEEKTPSDNAPPPPTARNSRLENLIQKAADRTKREASSESGSSEKSATMRNKRRRGPDTTEVPVVRREASHEAIIDLRPEDSLEDAELAEPELTTTDPVPQVPLPISQDILADGSHRLDVPLVADEVKDETDLPAEEEEVNKADISTEELVPSEKAHADANLPSVSSDINAEGEAERKMVEEKDDTVEPSKETVKPVFDMSDSEMELPSFEMPEDSYDVKRRASTGKLDLMLKKNMSPEKTNAEGPSGSPKESEASPESASKVGDKRPLVEPSTTKSVLHEALVRPFNAHRDLIQGVGLRRAKPSLSMAGTQSHLIAALGASAKPGSSSEIPTDQARRMASSPSAESSSSSSPREEVLGRLLAGGEAQRKAPPIVPPVRSQPVAVTHQRPILPKLDNSATEASRIPDGRRINALSDQLNLNAARNAQARNLRAPDASSMPSSLQRSLLARSLNAPPGTRLTLPNSFANGSSSPSTSRLPVNGNPDEAARSSSPLTSQLPHNLSTMRNLLAQRSTGSPGLQALEASRNSAISSISRSNAAAQSSATAANKRASPTGSVQSVMQSESIQSQIELFLRNTKKLVKDKRAEGAETTREISRANAECIRFMQDSHLKSLQTSDRTIQDLQETLEQSVRKFELLFMVLQNETEFSQKAKILEVSRMKDLERQRAITTAKRTLWCCVCQKRAKYICCGVTLYCSETCQLNNSPLHRLHCQRNRELHEDGDINVYTPYGVLTRCAGPLAGEEEEEDDLGGDGGGTDNGGAPQSSNAVQTNGWDPRGSRNSSGVNNQEPDMADD